MARLIGHYTDTFAVQTSETHDQVRGEQRLDFQEVAVVNHAPNHFAHVIRNVLTCGDDLLQLDVGALGKIGGLHHRRCLPAVLGEEGEQVAHLRKCLVLGIRLKMCDAAPLRVNVRTAELLLVDLLSGGDAHHIRASDKHVTDLAHHEGEIGDRRRIDCSTGARPGDDGQLRDHATGAHVAVEDVRVSGERHHPLLDARPRAVVDADHRRPGALGQLHHLAHFFGERFTQRSPHERRVVGEDEHLSTSNQAVPGDDTIAHGPALRHVELGRAVGHEGVQLDEATPVEQAPDALPGSQLALAALDSLRLSTPVDRVVTTLAELVYQPLVGARNASRPPFGLRWPRRLALGPRTCRSRLGLGHLLIFADLPAAHRLPAAPKPGHLSP